MSCTVKLTDVIISDVTFFGNSSIKDSEPNIRTLCPKKSLVPIEIVLIISLTLYSDESNSAKIVFVLCNKDYWNTYFSFKFHCLLQLFWITRDLHCQKHFRILGFPSTSIKPLP